MSTKKLNDSFLGKVFMDATDAIIIEDQQGTVIELNHAAERTYGWSRKELVGQSIKRIIPEFRHGGADDLLAKCIAGETVSNIEAERVARDGTRIHTLLTLTLLKDSKGKPKAVASYAKDITDLKASSAAHERMAKVFMDATDAIIIETCEGVVLDMNKAAVTAYGWSRDELVGEPIKKIIPRFRHKGADDLLKRCLEGEEVKDVEVVRVGRDGTEYKVLLTLSPLLDADGKASSVASYAKDITELRRLEEEQRKEREAVIKAQAESLAELSTPVTEVWGGVLLLPIVGIVDSRRALDIMNSVLESIAEKQARQLILDISGVAVVDTAVANNFIKISKATALMGCTCSISGVSPAIAQTIVDLGIDVGTIKTTGTMRDALVEAFKEIGVKVG